MSAFGFETGRDALIGDIISSIFFLVGCISGHVLVEFYRPPLFRLGLVVSNAMAPETKGLTPAELSSLKLKSNNNWHLT